MLEPYKSSDLWMDFDRAFDRFRRDFENLLWPSELPMMREMETTMPAVDLEDKGDKYVLPLSFPPSPSLLPSIPLFLSFQFRRSCERHQ